MGTLNLVLIIGSLVALATCQVKDPRCEDPAKKPSGFLPHPDPTECFKYISCYNGLSKEFTCPFELFHDKCNPEACKSAGDLKPECKCKNCPATGITRAPKQDSKFCDEYVMCVEGDEVSRICPEGQSFDTKSKICKDKETVECDMDLCSDTWNAATSKSTIGFVPSFRNCQKYFICSKGIKVSDEDCGAGFMYDVNTPTKVGDVQINGACVRIPPKTLAEEEGEEGDLNPDLRPEFEEEIGSHEGEIEIEVEVDTDIPGPDPPVTPKPPECFNGRNWIKPTLT